jgi:hypothetical protein
MCPKLPHWIFSCGPKWEREKEAPPYLNLNIVSPGLEVLRLVSLLPAYFLNYCSNVSLSGFRSRDDLVGMTIG